MLPTRAIVEGYAEHTEFILFGRLVHDMHEYKINPTIENNFYKKIDEIGKERYGGIYSVVRGMLYDKLGWIQKQRGWFEFYDTCSAIFEIALMTRFHPILLFCDSGPRLDEIFIPFRFQKALNFFFE